MAGETIQYRTGDGVTFICAIDAPSAVEQNFIEATAKVQKLAADKKREGN